MNFLRYDGNASQALQKLLYLVCYSIIWVIGCLPIISLGAVTATIMYALSRHMQQESETFLSALKCGFQRCWKVATQSWLIVLALDLVLAADVWIVNQLMDQGYFLAPLAIILYVLIALSIVYLFFISYYISSFEDGTKTVLKNCAIIMFANPLSILIISAILAGMIALLNVSVCFIVILPALAIWFIQQRVQRSFDRYNLVKTTEKDAEQE